MVSSSNKGTVAMPEIGEKDSGFDTEELGKGDLSIVDDVNTGDTPVIVL